MYVTLHRDAMILNPLMLTAVKKPDNFDKILQEKAKLGKYLMEKYQLEHHQKFSFKDFVKPFSFRKLLSKVL